MINIEEIVSETIKQIKSAITSVNKKTEFARLPDFVDFELQDPSTGQQFKFQIRLLNYYPQPGIDMPKTMKHSDAKQDKKLINKIVDTKIARSTRADKRQDAKLIKKVVKKPRR